MLSIKKKLIIKHLPMTKSFFIFVSLKYYTFTPICLKRLCKALFYTI